MRVRPYSIIIKFLDSYYEIILWLTEDEMVAWDKEVDCETVLCITDQSHQLRGAAGAVKAEGYA